VEGFFGKLDRKFRDGRRSLKCQEVTELVHPEEMVREQEVVEGKVDHEWDGWAATKQAQALAENACV
jgi:hypothetical protein